METGLLWFFLFIALAFGWVMGFLSKPKVKQEDVSHAPPEDIKHRLQLFFDSYNDQSIDQFVQSLEVSSETVGLHISIGKHFRTNGEVEKAILIHQNLMAHPELDDSSSEPVIYELAKDYKLAGLLDRAESLLKQLNKSKAFGLKSLTLLLDIYEQEQEWQNAINTALQVDLKKNPDIALRAAYYCCEIAAEKSTSGELLEARRCLKKALNLSKSCIRAYVALAELEISQQNYRSAINQLRQAAEISPENIAVVLPLLQKCTAETGSYEQYRTYLSRLYHTTGQIDVMLAVVDSLLAEGKSNEALFMLEEELLKAPSIKALGIFFERTADRQAISENLMGMIRKVVTRLKNEASTYQCGQCGFSGKQMHWMCPSCKQWQTMQPKTDYISQD